MRKILFLFIVFIIALLLTSCKPVLSANLSNIKYIEYLRLRGQTNEYFIEVVIGKNPNDFVKIVALPKKVRSADIISYVYGEYKGQLVKREGKLIDEIETNERENFIVLIVDGKKEIVHLYPMTMELDAERVLERAFYHFQSANPNSDKKNLDIRIKILADMHGNAFVFVSFEGEGEFYSLLFDNEPYDIIAEYNF